MRTLAMTAWAELLYWMKALAENLVLNMVKTRSRAMWAINLLSRSGNVMVLNW